MTKEVREGEKKEVEKEKACILMDEFDVLLLSAAHKNNVVSLQSHLSSVSDPNVYLNRVYKGPNEQKCTLLMIACLNEYTDIVSMLLSNFKFDLEVLNVIQINDNKSNPEIFQNVTVLWAAVANDKFSIVKLLVEHGAAINHATNTNSTPLRCACYNGNVDMARYLIKNGADIHINKENNQTNLALTVYCKHFKMTAYLIDELGCDVNECDNDGRSPLYFAVTCKSLEMVQFLLTHGARNFPDTHHCISPLMLAAEEKSYELMYAIAPYCSIVEQIEAEELLGSSFACAEHGPCDFQQSYEHYYHALQLRSIHNLPKVLKESTSEIFNNRKECQTIDQLEELRSNSENMHIEALLVRERLLGSSNDIYRYSVTYYGAMLVDSAQFSQAIALWLYELKLRQQHAIVIDPKRLRRLASIFSRMLDRSLPISIEEILTVIAITVAEVKHNTEQINYHLHTLLFLITIISQSSVNVHMSTNERRVIYRLIHSINQGSYNTREYRSSLLHLSLNNLTSASNNFINQVCKYPCLSTVRMLLHCGANVNATDVIGNTPLHTLVSNSSVCDETILQLLCDAGAHLDYANALGKTPVDMASSSNTKQLLQTKAKINLKCLCARLIRKFDIPFHGKITLSLINFVERH